MNLTSSRMDADSLEVTSATWPSRDDLPTLENIWLGGIIAKCWTRGAFRNARDLLSDLESISDEDGISPRSITLAMMITAIVVFTAWRWKRSLVV